MWAAGDDAEPTNRFRPLDGRHLCRPFSSQWDAGQQHDELLQLSPQETGPHVQGVAPAPVGQHAVGSVMGSANVSVDA